VFNLVGQKVATLVNETRQSGSCRVEWRPADSPGVKPDGGVYFYRMTVIYKDYRTVQTKKMILVD